MERCDTLCQDKTGYSPGRSRLPRVSQRHDTRTKALAEDAALLDLVLPGLGTANRGDVEFVAGKLNRTRGACYRRLVEAGTGRSPGADARWSAFAAVSKTSVLKATGVARSTPRQPSKRGMSGGGDNAA